MSSGAHDLVITDLQRPGDERRNPSSELGMHLLIYSRRPDINAVCHAHPPAATGYAAAAFLSTKQSCANWFSRSAAFHRATERLEPQSSPEASSPSSRPYEAILMANRRRLLRTGFARHFFMETTEHFARVALVTELIGKQVLLSSGDVEALRGARRYGVQSSFVDRSNCRSHRTLPIPSESR